LTLINPALKSKLLAETVPSGAIENVLHVRFSRIGASTGINVLKKVSNSQANLQKETKIYQA